MVISNCLGSWGGGGGGRCGGLMGLHEYRKFLCRRLNVIRRMVTLLKGSVCSLIYGLCKTGVAWGIKISFESPMGDNIYHGLQTKPLTSSY